MTLLNDVKFGSVLDKQHHVGSLVEQFLLHLENNPHLVVEFRNLATNYKTGQLSLLASEVTSLATVERLQHRTEEKLNACKLACRLLELCNPERDFPLVPPFFGAGSTVKLLFDEQLRVLGHDFDKSCVVADTNNLLITNAHQKEFPGLKVVGGYCDPRSCAFLPYSSSSFERGSLISRSLDLLRSAVAGCSEWVVSPSAISLMYGPAMREPRGALANRIVFHAATDSRHPDDAFGMSWVLDISKVVPLTRYLADPMKELGYYPLSSSKPYVLLFALFRVSRLEKHVLAETKSPITTWHQACEEEYSGLPDSERHGGFSISSIHSDLEEIKPTDRRLDVGLCWLKRIPSGQNIIIGLPDDPAKAIALAKGLWDEVRVINAYLDQTDASIRYQFRDRPNGDAQTGEQVGELAAKAKAVLLVTVRTRATVRRSAK